MERATSLSRPRTSPQLVGAVFLGVRPSTASSRHCGGCHASPLRRSMETNHHGRVGSLHSLRGTHTRVHSETSTLTRPKRTSVGTRPVSRSHRRLTGQTGGGKGTRPFFSRFLQTSFLSTKEKRQMETSDRPKGSESFLEQAHVQDGNNSSYQELYPARTLGRFIGPVRRVLSCTNTPQYRKYLRFAFKGQVFQFRAMPFGLATTPRDFTKLMAVVGSHLRLKGAHLPSTSTTGSFISSVAKHSSTTRPFRGKVTFPRPSSQCREVRTHTYPRFHFRRYELPDAPQQGQNSLRRIADLID